MSPLEKLALEGTPLAPEKKTPVTDEQLYWHMHEQGKKRFGSECRHEQKVGGTCTKCLRTVI